MSSDNYRLLRTDSNQEDDQDIDALEYGRPIPYNKSSPSRLASTWSNIRKLFDSKSLYSPLHSTTSPRRDSSSSTSSTNSYPPSSTAPTIFQQFYLHSFDGKYATRRIHKRLLGSLGLGLVCLLLWLHWETVERIYYVQFIMNTPGTACLVDRSGPDSYVQWAPDKRLLTNGQGPVYHCIRQRPQSHKLAAEHQKGASLRTWRPLPADCIDSYYSAGASCSDGQRTTLDVVWTWVNGSDPTLIRSKALAKAKLDRQRLREERQRQREQGATLEYLPEEDEEGEEELVIKEEENKHLYRDHDELRHSLRSVLENFRDSANKFTILTSDFDFPQDAVEDGEVEGGAVASARLGLLPQWLRFGVVVDESGQPDTQQQQQTIGHWKDGDIALEVVHHAEIYDEYDGTVFNSNSIESQIGNVAGDKAFLYFNDDCFFNAPLSGSDFHSSNYGLVFRLVAYPWMLLTPHHYPVDSGLGEWGPMEFTNYILSKRFGPRRRPYPMHQVKVLQGALMREMWEMWSEQERKNERHKFRGLGGLEKIGVGEEDEREAWMEELDPIIPTIEEEEEEDKIIEAEERELQQPRRQRRSLRRRDEVDTRSWHAPSIDEDEDERPRKSSSTSDNHRTNGSSAGGYSGLGGEDVDDGDAHVMFLFTHFVIERSREAMIWSYIVATLGGDDDAFGDSQRSRLREMLIKSANATERVLDTSNTTTDGDGETAYDVVVERRKTMEPWRVDWTLREVGDKLKGSEYLFSSQDGDAYSYYDDKGGLQWWHDGSTDWPKLWHEGNFDVNITARPDWTRCTIKWDTCFDATVVSASDMFKRVAFEKRECGDCLLKALVRASGDIGLSALLPPRTRTFTRQQPHQRRQDGTPVHEDNRASTVPPLKTGENAVAPFLPLTTTWQEADFSLNGVFASGFWDPEDGTGRVSLREWTQRLMERYRYVLADTGNYFNVIGNPVDAERLFAYVDDHPRVPLVTINDVIWEYPELTDERMRTWFDQRWSEPAAWEKPEGIVTHSSSSMFDAFHWTKRMEEEMER